MARYKKRIFVDPTPSLFDSRYADDSDTEAEERGSTQAMSGGTAARPDTGTGIEPVTLGPSRDVLRFISFGSGSSGNSAYLGDDHDGILIDAGIDGKVINDTLAAHGIPMGRIRGIILTHDHGDHVRYLYSILRANRTIPLYCTRRTMEGMLRRHSMSRRVRDYHRPIYKEIPFAVGPMQVTAFEVSHDGTDNAGFSIVVRGHTFVVATDLGTVGERALHYISGANHLMVESNYDRMMLVNGTRPEYLKARILGEHGHLDNNDTAALLRGVYGPQLRDIFLCHLSEDNNTPELALATARAALAEAGASAVGDASGSTADLAAPVRVAALTRFTPTPLYTLS